MKKYVRCKVCGYIMEEDKLKDVCPVCGVPKTAFVEYKYNINEKRYKILSMHLHPISVHFPESIAVFLTFFIFLTFFNIKVINDNLLVVNKTLSIFFPLSVLATFLLGIYDAKIRFKKLSPPYLKIKIYLGIILFVLSIINLILFFCVDYTLAAKIILMLISLINVGICIVLGKMGSGMIDSVMPG